MYAAGLPLAVCFVAVFMPPRGLGQTGLFVWLLGFASATRFAMTLFAIPHQSLVPELTQDYDERTSLQTLRLVFAWLFGLAYVLLAYGVFLRATPRYPQGLLNPEGYVGFAVRGAVIMLVTTLVSALGTQRAALRAEVDDSRIEQVRLSALPRAMRAALQSPSYRTAVVGGLCLWVSFGVNQNLNNYLNTFLWGFNSAQLTFFMLVLIASSVLALAVTGPLAGKKTLDPGHRGGCPADLVHARFCASGRPVARQWRAHTGVGRGRSDRGELYRPDHSDDDGRIDDCRRD